MKAIAIFIPLLFLFLRALAAEKPDDTTTDRLPQPHYHRQASDPAWLTGVVQFHGHLGPSVVAGARIGMIGLRAVGAKGYFDVEVTCEGPLAKPPQSCFLDGVQVTTGATLGKRTLLWVPADRLTMRIKNVRTGKTAVLRPTPALMELLAPFKPQPKAGADQGHEDDEQLEAIARKIAAMPDKEVAVITEMIRAEEPSLKVPEYIERGMLTDPGEQKIRVQKRLRDRELPIPERKDGKPGE
jgi:formylmethanofuran dehydrogenase subunit E